MMATFDATQTTQVYAIDKMHSEVAFQVRHLLTKVRGRFSEFSGTVLFDEDHRCPVPTLWVNCRRS